MPAPCHTPRRGNSKPSPGGRVGAERSSERKARVTPPNTPHTPGSVSLGRIHRKRSSDGPVDGSTPNKRRGLSTTTPNPSPLASDRVGLAGPPQTPVIDLTGDDVPQTNSSDSKKRVKSTSNTFFDSSTSQARSAPRYTRSLFSSTPTPGAKRKIEVIDLVSDDDSDHGSTAPSSTQVKKTVQPQVMEDVFRSPDVEKRMALGRLVDHTRQQPESKHGQARPANLAEKNGTTMSTRSRARVYPSSATAFRPGQLTNGSPRAYKGMTAPMKSAFAQKDIKNYYVPFANDSKPIEAEADPDHLRRGSESVPRDGVQELGLAVRLRSIADKNGDEKRSVDGKTDADGSNGIDSAPDETRDLSKIGSSGPGLAPSEPPFKWPPFPFARNMPSTSFSLQGRAFDLSYSVQTRNGGNGFRQTVEKESAGVGDRITTLDDNDLGVSVEAGQLQKPLDLMLRGQAEEQSERVADGCAGGSDEHDGRGLTSLKLAIGRKDDTQDELQPPSPRSSRRRRSRIVVLRARPDELRRISQRPVQRPEIPMDVCFLTQIPREIQENIFKNLLLANDPIQVLHGWSKLYQRQRSNLYPAILSTCREIYKNASVFLYGRNVFRYMVRDRAESDAFPSFGQDINVEEYMPLFRKLELKIERSRTERAYCTSLANAIHLLNRNGAKLHTLALDVSPLLEGDTLSTVGYFYQGGEIIQALKALKTCFIVVRVFTPKTKDEPTTSLRRKLDMRTELCRWEKAPDQPPETQLDDLSEKITAACESPSKVVERGWFEKFEVVPQQNERRARPPRITYNNEDDDDEDDDDGTDENDDGDDSGDFRG